MNYGNRLETAISLAAKTRKQLSDGIGVTPQAISQVIGGVAKAFSAENNARAARFLDVDAFWLATGEGQARPLHPWPFPMILPGQYAQLDADFRRQIENNVVGEWMRAQQQRKTGS